MFKNPSVKTSWEEHKERAQKAARRTRQGSCTVANLKTDQPDLWPVHPGRQCLFVGKVLGRQCKNWAVKGAKRCHVHGGLREAPDHPANGRAWLKGQITDHDMSRAAFEHNNKHPKVKETVKLLREIGIVAKPPTLKAALDALDQDDNGKAWRRFVKSAPTKKKKEKKGEIERKDDSA